MAKRLTSKTVALPRFAGARNANRGGRRYSFTAPVIDET